VNCIAITNITKRAAGRGWRQVTVGIEIERKKQKGHVRRDPLGGEPPRSSSSVSKLRVRGEKIKRNY